MSLVNEKGEPCEVNDPWVDEQKELPATGKTVVICLMRKAQRWEFVNPEPIDINRDTVLWMPDQS